MKKNTSTKDNKKDTQSRKYLLTINNPIEKELSHDKIKELINSLKSTIYYCMADEQGLKEETPHTHIFIVFRSPVRFSTIKNLFPTAHIDKSLGTSAENKAYVEKSGKWESSSKYETIVNGSFEEWGELPNEHQGNRTDLAILYNKIKDGLSNYDLFEENPDNIEHLKYIDKVRQTIIRETVKNQFRQLEVTYIFGESATGKTRYVMEKYGYENVHRVTDYIHPFDSYEGQEIILFDEFCSNFKIQEMLNYLDGYPIELPARYCNKWAAYSTIFLVSNLPLSRQYPNIQEHEFTVWKAFLRRIHKVEQFMGDGDIIKYSPNDFLHNTTANIIIQNAVKNYRANKNKQLDIFEQDGFIELPSGTPTPFDE